MKKLIVFILFSVLFFSCKQNEKRQNIKSNLLNSYTTLKYAKGFSIQHFKKYTQLIIKAPYPNSTELFKFILTTQKDNSIPDAIQIPLKSVVVTSTTHIPMLELLGVESKLIGFPNTDYISSKNTRKLVDKNSIKDLGNEENINTELLIEINPAAVIGFSLTSNNKMFTNIKKIGIPVILNGDWLEETPLGRAEWIKFFGVLFDKEKLADSIFNNIEASYLNAVKIALKAKNIPTVISGGLYKDVWYLPAGDSFEATFFKDANCNYLYKNTKGTGSLALNIESVFFKSKDASLWISPSYYNSMQQLKNANVIYQEFKAVKNNRVFSYVNKKGEKGGITYFEFAPARPDFVLKDIIKIAHPELLNNYQLHFFQQLK